MIVGAARTPVGSFRSSLASVPAPLLGALAARGALAQPNLPAASVQEVFFGNVLSAGLGQAPASQVARMAGLKDTTPATLINKVCASGLKAVMLGAMSVQVGATECVLAGGMESMSQSPYYLSTARAGFGYGHQQTLDAILKDGLWDAQYQVHMGSCAEETAKKLNISRQEQDAHAIQSYKRAAKATADGIFKSEIVHVPIKSKKKDLIITEDEEFRRVNFDKVPLLKPVFDLSGTVTAANASTLNDGASALLLMSAEKANQSQVKPLARILGYADANRDPKEFTIAPTDAVLKLLSQLSLSPDDIAHWEINEAFSVVVLANQKLLGLDPDKVNPLGGGVSMGHPIGSSGSRILVTMVHALKAGEKGCAVVCNGGGGASALIVEKL